MNPLVIAALLAGGAILYARSRSKKKAIADSSAPYDPSGGGGPNGNGAPDSANDGFLLLEDCIHMTVQDPRKAADTIASFYRSNILNQPGSRFSTDIGAADAHARAFFSHYFREMAPLCLVPTGAPGQTLLLPVNVITGPHGANYVMPTQAPLAQKIMYAYLFSLYASLLLNDQRWNPAQAEAQMTQLVAMLRAAGVTGADWQQTFQGTVPMPEALKPPPVEPEGFA